MKVVAITGLHRGDNPQPGSAVITSLRRRYPDLRVVGLSYDPLESCLYSRGDDRLDAAYLLPYPRSGIDALEQRLEEILDRQHVDIVIPCLDSELSNFIALKQKLSNRGIQCMLPTKHSLDKRSKQNLPVFCVHVDVQTPRTRIANDPATLAGFADEIGYPVYVKGKYYEAHLVNTRVDLVAAFNEIVSVWGGPVLVQQALVGEEYDIVGLGDGQGGMIGHCAIRKMLRTPAGKGFAGVVVVDPELDQIACRIIGALHWNGPFELEFLKVPHGRHVLLEMNPRFPAWVDFPSQVGCNLPASLFESLVGMRHTPLRPCPPGRMFVRHCVDLAGDIADLAKMASAGERGEALAAAEFEVR